MRPQGNVIVALPLVEYLQERPQSERRRRKWGHPAVDAGPWSANFLLWSSKTINPKITYAQERRSDHSKVLLLKAKNDYHTFSVHRRSQELLLQNLR